MAMMVRVASEQQTGTGKKEPFCRMNIVYFSGVFAGWKPQMMFVLSGVVLWPMKSIFNMRWNCIGLSE